MTVEQIKPSLLKSGLKPHKIVEIDEYASWINIYFQALDYDDMICICRWINKTFRQKGKYTHTLPKLASVTNRYGKDRNALVIDSQILKNHGKIN